MLWISAFPEIFFKFFLSMDAYSTTFRMPHCPPGGKLPLPMFNQNQNAMVTIIGFEKRENQEGEEFNVLILQGGVEAIISQKSGKPYITARKTSIPCTFGDEFAKSLIGTELPGDIQRIECDEYTYEVPSTGEKLKLTHTYQYNADPASLVETVMG